VAGAREFGEAQKTVRYCGVAVEAVEHDADTLRRRAGVQCPMHVQVRRVEGLVLGPQHRVNVGQRTQPICAHEAGIEPTRIHHRLDEGPFVHRRNGGEQR